MSTRVKTRSMWVGAFSKAGYDDKLALGDDVVRILRDELSDREHRRDR